MSLTGAQSTKSLLFLFTFALTLLAVVPPAMAVEEPEYTVLATTEQFEVRRYDSMRLAVYEAEGDFENIGGQAFRPLFGYIAGKNASETRFAMTAPVIQQPAEDRWQVAFILPAGTRLEDLPAPDSSAVQIIEQPATTMAVIRYSGTWSKTRFLEHEQKLRTALSGSRWTACGDAVWARYNGPFTPWFMRRNEVQIPVSQGSDCEGAD